jgi:23S rRNA (adenine2503-C2)-methyltransferase
LWYRFQLMLNLIGLDLEEIRALVAELGQPAFRARQIYAGIYRRRLRCWDEFSDVSKALRGSLQARFTLSYPRISQTFLSGDGARRYLFELLPEAKVEAVLIPEDDRDTFCISSQAGCAVECLFCVTGKLPMRRNLTAGEIAGQVLTLQSDRADPARRLNIVMMGMGEPLHNYDNVMKAIRLMSDSEGLSISPRRITISTSGVVPGIRQLAREKALPNLAISLNATTDAVRDLLIPINRKWNISALLQACREFPLENRRRITFEYVLIDGINDTIADAHRLVKLLRGLRTKVNLISLNEDPWIPLRSSPWDRVMAFQQVLVDHHISAYVRRPRGTDVSAACGMLAGRERSLSDARQQPPRPSKASQSDLLKAARDDGRADESPARAGDGSH